MKQKYVVVDNVHDIKLRLVKNRVINRKRKLSLMQCGFDIETTNLIDRDENGDVKSAFACMYHWQLCIDKYVLLGRTWDELDYTFRYLDKKLKTTLIVWVANLGFEFSFLCSHYEIKKCFAKSAWKPMYFKILNHIEFHDCLQVTGGDLGYLAENYCSPENQKLKGDLDFTKMRNYNTVMNEKEKQYCINDVTILSEFAGYIFEHYNDVPLTKTGILRAEVKREFEKLSKDAQEYIKNLCPEQDEYNVVMKYLFQGGFTHANFLGLNQKFSEVAGIDIASSYPAVMMQEYFPMTAFVKTELKTDGHFIMDEKLNTKCVYFTAEFTGVQAKLCHTILSEHKIMLADAPEYDNGRLYRANAIRVMMTEIDYEIFAKFYKWKHVVILDAKCAERMPLPDYMTKLIKYYYAKKSELKSAGKSNTLEYMLAKQAVNSFYGMTVTRVVQHDLKFDNTDKQFKLSDNPKPWTKIKKSAIMSPFWGVWVTAHARKRLLDMIYHITMNSDGFSDAIYSDTDSIYLLNYPKHKSIIDEFNQKISDDNKKWGKHFETLGTYDDVKMYDFFKTIGSKKYMTEKQGNVSATIAGVDGDVYCQHIPANEDAFDWFDFEKTNYLDFDISGKHGHHYFFEPDLMLQVDDGETVCDMECFSGCAIYDIPFGIRCIRDVWKQMIVRVMTERGILPK